MDLTFHELGELAKLIVVAAVVAGLVWLGVRVYSVVDDARQLDQATGSGAEVAEVVGDTLRLQGSTEWIALDGIEIPSCGRARYATWLDDRLDGATVDHSAINSTDAQYLWDDDGSIQIDAVAAGVALPVEPSNPYHPTDDQHQRWETAMASALQGAEAGRLGIWSDRCHSAEQDGS